MKVLLLLVTAGALLVVWLVSEFRRISQDIKRINGD